VGKVVKKQIWITPAIEVIDVTETLSSDRDNCGENSLTSTDVNQPDKKGFCVRVDS
jgi:hypothetical protein